MTEAAEEARAEAKRIPGVAGRASRGEASAAAPTIERRRGPPPSDGGARAPRARRVEAAADSAWPAAEGARPAGRAHAHARDDVGGRFRGGAVARPAARRAAVDAGLRAEELASPAARRSRARRRFRRAGARDGQASREAARRGGGRTRRVGGARCRTRARPPRRLLPNPTAGAEAAPRRRDGRRPSRPSPPRVQSPVAGVSVAHAIARPTRRWKPSAPRWTRSWAPERASRASRNARVRRARALRRRRRGDADEATARRIAFFCFKFWQQLAATPLRPRGRAATPGTPRSARPRPHRRVRVRRGRRDRAREPGGGDALDGGGSARRIAARRAAAAGAGAAVCGRLRGGGAPRSPAMIDPRTPPLERWASGEPRVARDTTDARVTSRGATEG